MSVDEGWETPSASGMLTTSSEEGAGSSLQSMRPEYSLGTGGGAATATITRSVDSLADSSTDLEREDRRSLSRTILSASERESSEESYMEGGTVGVPFVNDMHLPVSCSTPHPTPQSRRALGLDLG